jgi:hypothetical protein
MTKFNPPRKQATDTLGRAIMCLADALVIKFTWHKPVVTVKENIEYTRQSEFSKDYIGIPKKIRLMMHVLHAIGEDGRRGLSKFVCKENNYRPFELVDNSPTAWSMVIDVVLCKEMKEVRSVILHVDEHPDTGKPTIAFDFSFGQTRYDTVISREPSTRKNLTTEQLKRAYSTYLKYGPWLLPHQPTLGLVGWSNSDHELGHVLSGLGTPSLMALVREMNLPDRNVKVDTYELETYNDFIAGKNGRDDDVGWSLTHYRATSDRYVGVHYVLVHRHFPRIGNWLGEPIENVIQKRILDETQRCAFNCRLLAEKHEKILQLKTAIG